jgi:hypothetical protein
VIACVLGVMSKIPLPDLRQPVTVELLPDQYILCADWLDPRLYSIGERSCQGLWVRWGAGQVIEEGSQGGRKKWLLPVILGRSVGPSWL